MKYAPMWSDADYQRLQEQVWRRERWMASLAVIIAVLLTPLFDVHTDLMEY